MAADKLCIILNLGCITRLLSFAVRGDPCIRSNFSQRRRLLYAVVLRVLFSSFDDCDLHYGSSFVVPNIQITIIHGKKGWDYYWILVAINNTVTVTGMEVKTTVGSNLFIAPTTADATTLPAPSEFKSSLVTTIAESLIEPASSINGMNGTFYYTSTTNVQNLGDAVRDEYILYDETSSAAIAAFSSNYNTSNAVPYVDYVVCLQADNTDPNNDLNLAMTKANITNNLDITTAAAFRIAVLIEKWNPNASGYAPLVNKTVLAKEDSSGASALYFTDGKAVTNTTTLASIENLAAEAKVDTVLHETKEYYRVTVRLWLEGEDEECNNDTFAKLSDGIWGLDLEFKLGPDSDVKGIAKYGYAPGTAFKIATGATSTTTIIAGDGRTYYEYDSATATDGSTPYGTNIYATVGTIADNTELFTITNGYVTNVTYLRTFVTP